MKNIEFEQPYTLQQLIKHIIDGTKVEGDFCIYTKDYDPIATSELVCYLSEHPQVSEDDEEIYPNFVVNQNLSLFLYGEDLEDIIRNARNQKASASINEIIDGVNFYIENDNFITIK